MKKNHTIAGWLMLLALSTVNLQPVNLQPSTAFAQGTAFTYQGQLDSSGSPATGIYDLQFTIYDAATNGNVVGGVLTNAATPVANGLFTVTLDFGAGVITGPARWLELAVQTNGSGSFTTLAPRQQLTPTPYAIYSATAGSATTATTAGGVAASGIGAGTANISITGNAGTATSAAYATSAGMAYTAITATTATNLTGNVSDAQLSANIALLNGTNSFTGTNTFAGVAIATNANNVIAGALIGNGSGMSNLNPANLSAGTAGINISGNASTAGIATNTSYGGTIAGLSGTNTWTGTNIFGTENSMQFSTHSSAFNFYSDAIRIPMTPVATLRPVTDQSAMVLDLMPRDSTGANPAMPTNQLGTGICWIHLVNRDLTSASTGSAGNWNALALIQQTNGALVQTMAGGTNALQSLQLNGASLYWDVNAVNYGFLNGNGWYFGAYQSGTSWGYPVEIANASGLYTGPNMLIRTNISAGNITATNGIVLPQLVYLPTNSIPVGSTGVTNWVLLNLTNYGPILIATNAAAGLAGSFQKITFGSPVPFP